LIKSGHRRHWRNLIQIGIVNIYFNRYNNAIEYFEKAVEEKPRLTKTCVGQILTALKQGKFTGLDDELYRMWAM